MCPRRLYGQRLKISVARSYFTLGANRPRAVTVKSSNTSASANEPSLGEINVALSSCSECDDQSPSS